MRRWASSRRSNAGWKSMRANPMPDQRDALRNIRTFPQLIKFLRDELEWPIESEDFEELTFDYTPEELGIDTKIAAKIEKNGIKRLRQIGRASCRERV